jgi:tRNA-splicing ligase RtcB
VIARFYNGRAVELNRKWHSNIPNKDLAFLPVNTQEGQDYIKDMNFALDYAKENRRIIMESFMSAFQFVYEEAEFGDQVNIHHNYAALESHFDKDVWVHRKGATSAKKDETGIIPGSMGTSSYIVKGLGNIESFMSCSHGAGRVMGRMQATRTLTPEECDKAMDGIIRTSMQSLKPSRI